MRLALRAQSMCRVTVETINFWRLCHMSRSDWTPERREKMRTLIHSWAPWQHSTGPRTPEGKARVARNGWRGGKRAELRDMLHALREHDRDDDALMTIWRAVEDGIEPTAEEGAEALAYLERMEAPGGYYNLR